MSDARPAPRGSAGQFTYRDSQGRLMAVRAREVRDGATVAERLSESLELEMEWHPA